jgi:hypothetical protein
MACPKNCLNCQTQAALNGSLYTNCTQCSPGFT